MPQSQQPSGPARESLLLQTREFLASGSQADDAEALFRQYGPRLEAFLRGRLPPASRGLLETVDLAQEVWARALAKLDAFEARDAGSFWSYLRRAATNHLTDVYRRAGANDPSQPGDEEPLPDPPAPDPSPSMQVAALEAAQAFDLSLDVLAERNRRAVLLRVELDQSWEEIARDCEYPNAEAARKAVQRALARVCAQMAKHAPG